MIAVTEVPRGVREEVEHVAGFDWDAWLETETAGPRRITTTKSFAVIAPLAPRFPGETWFVPKAHSSHFEHISDDLCDELADTLHELLARIDSKLKNHGH